jgi:uncharacterized protein YodC (DUF2158 family)
VKKKTEFQRGDVVRLKSGGPSMVVDHLNTDSYQQSPAPHWHPNALCVWFDAHDQLANGYFALDLLEHAD